MSIDLQNEFPDDKGFSARNLWYMTQWCLFYSQEPQFPQRVIAEIQLPAQKLQQLVAEIPAKFSEDELQLSKKLINKLTEDTP